MAVLSDLYIKKETLETMLKVLNAKKQNGLAITIAINDETRHFTFDNGNTLSQNTSSWVSQSKEDREAGKEKFYVGNGKCFWMNETGAVLASNPEDNNSEAQPTGAQSTGAEPADLEDLPF